MASDDELWQNVGRLVDLYIKQQRAIDDMQDQIDELIQAVHQLRAVSAEPPDADTMPSPYEVDRVHCQMRDNRGVDGEQRKKTNRSAWRLKFQFYRGTDDIYRFYLNTCLARQFAKRHKAGYAKASELAKGLFATDIEGCLAGMRWQKTHGKRGTIWFPDQVAIMYGHEADQPVVIAILDDHDLTFTDFKEVRSHHADAARWSADWYPSR